LAEAQRRRRDPRQGRESHRRLIRFDKFKEEFQAAGLGQFGSGWVWLEVKDGKVAVRKTANAENPLIFGAKPILVADVWEHSYYIDYRNRRADYLKAFLDHLVNWGHVEEMLEAATK
jgi:Fe-Mn family superoxide dismutase